MCVELTRGVSARGKPTECVCVEPRHGFTSTGAETICSMGAIGGSGGSKSTTSVFALGVFALGVDSTLGIKPADSEVTEASPVGVGRTVNTFGGASETFGAGNGLGRGTPRSLGFVEVTTGTDATGFTVPLTIDHATLGVGMLFKMDVFAVVALGTTGTDEP